MSALASELVGTVRPRMRTPSASEVAPELVGTVRPRMRTPSASEVDS
jgi:hypothetical protein